MEIAKAIAGFTPAEADDLRKAIGKKIHALMASLKDKFLEGCIANATSEQVARQLWDDIEKAQDYSFNKSHAACYALIAYQTAWLRANHPCEYMAALISSVMNTKDKVPFYVNACDELGHRGAAAGRQLVAGRLRRRRGQDPLRPERGQGRRRGRGRRDRPLPRARAARTSRSGTSPSASTARSRTSARSRRSSSAARSTRPAPRARGCSRCSSRRSRGARSSSPTGCSGQGSIFDLGDAVESAAEAPPAGPARGVREARAAEAREGDARPLRLRAPARTRSATSCGARPTARSPSSSAAATARSSPSPASSAALKQLTTKKGDPMVFLRLEDVTGGAEVVVFNTVYAQARELCVVDRILVVKGRIDHKEGETKLLALEVAGVRGGAENARGAAAARRAQGARRHRSASSPPSSATSPASRRMLVDVDMSEGRGRSSSGPKVAAGTGLLRRGEGAARRGRDRLTGRATGTCPGSCRLALEDDRARRASPGGSATLAGERRPIPSRRSCRSSTLSGDPFSVVSVSISRVLGVFAGVALELLRRTAPSSA